MPAVDLARKVVTDELRVQNEEQSHWMYRLEKAESGRKQIQKIVETKNGSLSQLLSIDGHDRWTWRPLLAASGSLSLN
jgi:hypothetical protein